MNFQSLCVRQECFVQFCWILTDWFGVDRQVYTENLPLQAESERSCLLLLDSSSKNFTKNLSCYESISVLSPHDVKNVYILMGINAELNAVPEITGCLVTLINWKKFVDEKDFTYFSLCFSLLSAITTNENTPTSVPASWRRVNVKLWYCIWDDYGDWKPTEVNSGVWVINHNWKKEVCNLNVLNHYCLTIPVTQWAQSWVGKCMSMHV